METIENDFRSKFMVHWKDYGMTQEFYSVMNDETSFNYRISQNSWVKLNMILYNRFTNVNNVVRTCVVVVVVVVAIGKIET